RSASIGGEVAGDQPSPLSLAITAYGARHGPPAGVGRPPLSATARVPAGRTRTRIAQPVSHADRRSRQQLRPRPTKRPRWRRMPARQRSVSAQSRDQRPTMGGRDPAGGGGHGPSNRQYN